MSCNYPLPSRTRWASRSPARSPSESLDKETYSLPIQLQNAPLSIPVPQSGRVSAASNYTSTTAAASTFPRRHRRHNSAYATFNQSTDNFCPGVGGLRGGFCIPIWSTGDSPQVKETMRSQVVPLMDYQEYDALPLAIRRKYFSSLERLRYAQQQQQQYTAIVKPSSSYLRPSSATSRPRVPSRDSNESFQTSSLHQRQKLRKQQQNQGDAFILSQADAQWFLSLPEAIKRKEFSSEERRALTIKCESIIADAANEKLFKMNTDTERTRRASISSINSETSEVATLRRLSIDSDIENATNDFRNSFRWMDDNGDLDLRLQQFSEEKPVETPPPRKTRRTLSLTSRTSHRTHHSASASHSGIRIRPATLSRRNSLQQRSTVPGSSHTISAAAKPNFDADALYYQDPDARLKLRVYLASPQKFDEAVEFGFPSKPESTNFYNRPIPPFPTIRKVPKTPENFVEEMPANDEQPENRQLPSPMSLDFERADVDQRGRVVLGADGPQCVLDRYPHTMATNREMTLKMTLTRKDLREEDLTPPVTAEQATQPEQLPQENTTIDWDAIDREAESSIRRLWRKVAKRQN